MIEPYKVPRSSTLTDILYAFRKISEQLCEISAKLSNKDTSLPHEKVIPYKEKGFENEEEFSKLVANVDITTPEKLVAFKFWQLRDGSKGGLLELDTKVGTDII